MFGRKMFRIPYRLTQRVIPLEAVSLLVMDTHTLSKPQAIEKIALQFLSPELAAEYSARDQLLFSHEYLERLNEERLWCVGAESDAGLRAFAWLHEGLAEKRMNVGNHPGTATEIRLSEDAAFVFNVFTAPESRGLGLMAGILGYAAAELCRERGIRWLVTTTEITNDAARAGFRKSGFRNVGTYYRFGIGCRVWGSYPAPHGPINGFA